MKLSHLVYSLIAATSAALQVQVAAEYNRQLPDVRKIRRSSFHSAGVERPILPPHRQRDLDSDWAQREPQRARALNVPFTGTPGSRAR